MKSQVAAEAVAVADLVRRGWRPAHGHLRLVFLVDEETGGELGSRFMTEQHPDKVQCDLLVNEGGGRIFTHSGRRLYGVCCGEKGFFRFTLSVHGTAGHASMPQVADNALLKLAPVLTRFVDPPPAIELTEITATLLRSLGADPQRPTTALDQVAAATPELRPFLTAALSVTFAPTMVYGSDKVNVIPSRASIKVDCRVPPGLGDEIVRKRLAALLEPLSEEVSFEFNEQVIGNSSPPQSELMRAIKRWIITNDPGAEVVPVILTGFADSRVFREAFPGCVAYGFFRQRHQTMFEAGPLVHGDDERIDMRDLWFATRFYADLAVGLLGTGRG